MLTAFPATAQILKQPIPDKLVVLTFDDAVSTHATYVAPLLKKYRFGATFYVCEFPPDFEDKHKYMSWEQIRQLHQDGFEIGNHTGRHTHVNTLDHDGIVRELEVIEDRCAQLDIPRPITFAYPAYDISTEALAVLREKEYTFARIGGENTYDPLKDHPYLIPSFSTTGDDKLRILDAIQQARDGKIAVLTVHGVPDYAHDWVTTPRDLFEAYLQYLSDNKYTVIALKDLDQYIDPEAAAKAIQPALLQRDGNPIPEPEKVTIDIDLNHKKGPMEPVYAWFGHDEPNYTYMKDGRKLLTELSDLSPVPVFVRTHNLLTSGDGLPALKWGSTNAYTEDENGNPVYNWTIIDRIFDTYVERGMKPLVEIGFMPEALSSKPTPYRHDWAPGNAYGNIYTGWAYPPNDYDKWAELVFQWIRHSIDRYGQQEVESWYWELWNEPNIGYWQGTMEEYFKLYDYTADAVKRALPTATMGGPHSTGPSWDKAGQFLTAFLEHCLRGKNYRTGKTGSPVDFIAFHAKGGPKFIDNRVQMNMGTQLRDISRGFEIVASFPEYKNLPIVIGESDPEGCAACSMDIYPQNSYRNGTMYPSYTAAVFARKMDLADHFGVNFKGAVTWAFEFEDQPWFHGFRDLATNGVDKPVLNVFRMFGMMSGNRVAVSGDLAYDDQLIRDSSVRGERADISALATVDEDQAAVMVWNYHDDDVRVPAATVALRIKGLPEGRLWLSHYRVDEQHSNAYTLWKKMGSPKYPTAGQVKELEKAGQLELLEAPKWLDVESDETDITIQLPRQGVSLLKFSW
ncbi:MAG: polysaccharide deacetylase family protein [Saprospiraceae bacterium]|nr:polysaccharide deacetylase family protein [Lewinella sp.]